MFCCHENEDQMQNNSNTISIKMIYIKIIYIKFITPQDVRNDNFKALRH